MRGDARGDGHSLGSGATTSPTAGGGFTRQSSISARPLIADRIPTGAKTKTKRRWVCEFDLPGKNALLTTLTAGELISCSSAMRDICIPEKVPKIEEGA